MQLIVLILNESSCDLELRDHFIKRTCPDLECRLKSVTLIAKGQQQQQQVHGAGSTSDRDQHSSDSGHALSGSGNVDQQSNNNGPVFWLKRPADVIPGNTQSDCVIRCTPGTESGVGAVHGGGENCVGPLHFCGSMEYVDRNRPMLRSVFMFDDEGELTEAIAPPGLVIKWSVREHGDQQDELVFVVTDSSGSNNDDDSDDDSDDDDDYDDDEDGDTGGAELAAARRLTSEPSLLLSTTVDEDRAFRAMVKKSGRSVTVSLNNHTSRPLLCCDAGLALGAWACEPGARVEPRSSAQWAMVNADFMRGVRGRVVYSLNVGTGQRDDDAHELLHFAVSRPVGQAVQLEVQHVPPHAGLPPVLQVKRTAVHRTGSSHAELVLDVSFREADRKPLFGLPLGELSRVWHAVDSVPLPLRSLCWHVEQVAASSVNLSNVAPSARVLFCNAGASENMARLVEALERCVCDPDRVPIEECALLLDLDRFSLHDCCQVLKQFLLDLPPATGLISEQSLDALVRLGLLLTENEDEEPHINGHRSSTAASNAHGSGAVQERLVRERCQLFANGLPPLNRAVIGLVCSVVFAVTDGDPGQLNDLAMVFGPLFLPKTDFICDAAVTAAMSALSGVSSRQPNNASGGLGTSLAQVTISPGQVMDVDAMLVQARAVAHATWLLFLHQSNVNWSKTGSLGSL